MIDKTLIKKRFSKSLSTYEDNAIIQKIMADKLIELINDREYKSVFEIGCSTGILTRKIKEKINYNKYSAIDIVGEAREYVLQIINDAEFTEEDIETAEINENYDLIISNACMQWCNDFEKTMQKLISRLNYGGVLAVSVFAKENMKEIKSFFNLPQSQHPIISGAKVYEQEPIKIYFESPISVLNHIKLTGVNAIKPYKFTKTKLKEFEEYYKTNYTENGKVYLTYAPKYIIYVKPERY